MKRLIHLLVLIFLICPPGWAELDAVRIGISLPLSGSGAASSEKMRKAYEMAAEEINEKGGINGRKIELIVSDNRGNPVQASRAALSLIKGERVLALVGGWSSDLAWEIAQIAEQYHVPYILDHPSSERLTRSGFNYVFRISPTISMYFTPLEGFLMREIYPRLGRKLKVVYCFIDNSFGRSLWRRAKIFFESNRDKFGLVMVEPYRGLALDYRPLLLKMRPLDPDVVLFSSYITDAVLLAREAREVGIRATLFCGTGGGHLPKEFIEKAGDAGEGYFVSGPWRGNLRSSEYQAWRKRWIKVYGYEPGEEEAEGYSALYAVAQAAGSITSWDNLDKAREELKEALKQINMETVFGPLKFEDFHGYKNQNWAYGLTSLYQWQGGKLYCVWPKEIAERPYVLLYKKEGS